jgi:hypothetical protein
LAGWRMTNNKEFLYILKAEPIGLEIVNNKFSGRNIKNI